MLRHMGLANKSPATQAECAAHGAWVSVGRGSATPSGEPREANSKGDMRHRGGPQITVRCLAHNGLPAVMMPTLLGHPRYTRHLQGRRLWL